jgi:gliding motility-associated-like protein
MQRMNKKIIFYSLCYFFVVESKGQLCTTNGQTPVTAQLVCSSEPYHVTTPNYCGATSVPTPCTDGGTYQNKNPNFFRFICYNSGTLGFTIVPDEPAANYNWQLFDVTNTNPVDIFTNNNLFVACNWSGDGGTTGASIDGSSLVVCSGPQPLFSKMPDLQSGHSYLLMVSNESASFSGYELTFTGGTAIITDQADPHLLSADLNCDRTTVNLRFNKQVKCGTLTGTGSEFTINTGVSVISAVPGDCSTEFGTPYVILTLDQPLPFGNYTLTINNGSDGNTVGDICGRYIPAIESVPLVSAPAPSTPMDSVFNDACNADYIELVFRRPILCSSVAPDGSDFIITGPQTLTATPFIQNCNMAGYTTIIRLNLSASLTAGTYQVKLVTGTDGNTLLNDCFIQTPANSVVTFTKALTVSADFTTTNSTSCNQFTVGFLHDGANNVTGWKWNFGNGNTSTLQNPVITFTKGTYNVRLIVTNGFCSDTASKTITISDAFKAVFDAPSVLCPGDLLVVKDKSTGNIDGWQWNFGDGQTSILQNPGSIRYIDNGIEKLYTIRLIVSNSTLGCRDTVTRSVKKLASCQISVPTAFTPNRDGKNDFLYPLNALKVENLEFKVYDRAGQVVFASKDGTKKWDGRIGGLEQPTGIYAWILTYTDADTKNRITRKGVTLLLR